MILLKGFYSCPNPDCGRMHAYLAGPIHVQCACGAKINQFDLTYTLEKK